MCNRMLLHSLVCVAAFGTLMRSCRHINGIVSVLRHAWNGSSAGVHVVGGGSCYLL